MLGARWARARVGPRLALTVLAAVAVSVSAGGIASAGGSRAAGSGPITLPDLKILVPTNLISIGLDPSTGHRQLRFTHITSDVGSGPFEIDPTYNPSTGTATFVQAIYRSPSPGTWVLDHTVPVAQTGAWRPPSDYDFPLTRFTLNKLGSGGSLGAVVAVSPKSDYCITGDTELSGIPNTPDQTSPPQSDCTDPNSPLGWSVGWGDQYDQTDAGQPIDLTGVPDGTYVLHATVDPRHVFTESDTANDVTDTTLRIIGDNVTVLSQTTPGTVPPSVTLVSPHGGSTVSGTVVVRASASAHSPATVRSVQFLLDGQPLGAPVTRAPYSYEWTVGATTPGKHYLSARATDSGGDVGTARTVVVIVPKPSRVRVRSLRWRNGVLTVLVGGAPHGSTLHAKLEFAHRRSRSLTVAGTELRAHTPRPLVVVVRMFSGRRALGPSIAVRLNARPTVAITNPLRSETVSGIVPLSAVATDSVGISSVQFAVDGRRVGRVVSAPPYAVYWDTRKLARGTHTVTARATNVVGNGALARLRVTVENPAPPMTCFVLQHQVSVHGHGQVTTPPFHTATAGETLVAFVGGDGPAGPRQQSATVTGAGLKWRLVKRANASSGDSEVWVATAPRILTAAQVSAALANPGYDESLTVIAMEGTDGVGASVAASAPSGAPSLALRTLSSTSLVFATGNDWDNATARALPTGWVFLNQWLDGGTGDTYWSQYTNQPTGRAGSLIHVRDLAPAGDQWNMVAVELINSGD